MAADPRETTEFFLNDPWKLNDPFADLAYLREHRPVFYYAPVDQWFVFAYDDVAALFADPRLSADRMKGFVAATPPEVRDGVRRIAPYFETWALMQDAPAHTRTRRFLNLGFNAQAVRALQGTIQQAADDLLDRARIEERDAFDVCGEYAFLLPAYVLSDFMGVHQEDRDRVVQWSVDFVDFFNVIPITVETTERMLRSTDEMSDYTRALLAERRANPRADFLGVMAQAQSAGGDLTDDEIVGNAMLLLIAGHVAVRNLIGNVVYLLLTHPAEWARLRAAPDLLESAIEETLRYEPPVTLIPRVAQEDIPLRGETIRAGQIVQLSIASANRDPSHYPDPGRFDIARKPARVLSFGHGPHGCLGAHLARLQARIALETLFRRLPDFRLDDRREIVWYRNAGNRGPEVLPVTRLGGLRNAR